MRLTPERFWALDAPSYTALVKIHQGKRHSEMRMWAQERADFANVHFRHADKGQYQDAPFIADDYLGTGNRKQRTADLMQSRRDAALETQRLAKLGKKKPEGGGNVRVVDGKVVMDGVPDIFRQLAEQHEAEIAARGGKRG